MRLLVRKRLSFWISPFIEFSFLDVRAPFERLPVRHCPSDPQIRITIQTVHDMNIQYFRFSSSSYSRNSNTKYHNPYLPLPFTPRTTSASRGTESFNFNPRPHSHPRCSTNTERRRLLPQYCAGAPVSLAERRRSQRSRESDIRSGFQHWCTWPRDRPILSRYLQQTEHVDHPGFLHT
jgi:hypothetical protein